ncbi:MAG: hypothetical protein CBB92_09120 [Flammeovirgaceae bacterium TMED32]|nr:MAG: hypothetical protein CBB92_09120 [Flammeovirgaceae bacterium TMED32]
MNHLLSSFYHNNIRFSLFLLGFKGLFDFFLPTKNFFGVFTSFFDNVKFFWKGKVLALSSSYKIQK